MCTACLAVTAVTVQNSVGVTGVHTLPPETVAAQIEAVATDIGLDAAKTGMLATSAIIRAIAEACDRVGIGADGPTPFVVDPVAASMHGDQLLADEALDAFRSLLFPRATLVTPNLDEVRLLVGVDVHDRAAQYEAAKLLHAMGPRYVLVKGGHLGEDVDVCVDLLYDGHTFTELPGPRFATGDTHGSGDSMASAIAAGLARGHDRARGRGVRQALRRGGGPARLPARRGPRPGVAAVGDRPVVGAVSGRVRLRIVAIRERSWHARRKRGPSVTRRQR